MTVHDDGTKPNTSLASDLQSFMTSKTTDAQPSSLLNSSLTSPPARILPPLPPPFIGKGRIPPPAPPFAKGPGPPPPPTLGGRADKPRSKLKRSSEMGKLYRILKGKMEGVPAGKTAPGGKSQIPPTSGGNKGQGVSDAMAEMTNRSSYFRQIEEDIVNHAATILNVKSNIESFKTKDKMELLKFNNYVEKSLEPLTDETLVLSKFDDFPFKKLETLRLAAGLYKKLDSTVATLKGWKLVSPISQHLDKIESYFSKMRKEVDAIECSKDDDIKKFQHFKIEFDYTVLLRVKETMVDLSSSCIEMALKESRELKVASNKAKVKALPKMLWRVFILAYQVYCFAGGQDERAEKLTGELAHELQSLPQV